MSWLAHSFWQIFLAMTFVLVLAQGAAGDLSWGTGVALVIGGIGYLVTSERFRKDRN